MPDLPVNEAIVRLIKLFSTRNMAWYNKKYSGTKAAHMWQATAGIILVLTVVVVPASIDYIMRKEGKRYVGQTLSIGKVVDNKFEVPESHAYWETKKPGTQG